MGTKYYPIQFNLSKKQQKSIADAISSNSSVKLKILHKQLLGNGVKCLVTKMQKNKIEKAKSIGKGVIITLSKTQLAAMKQGGFLQMILPALVGSLAPILFNKIFDGGKSNNSGEGIYLPGVGQGINLPGMGLDTTQPLRKNSKEFLSVPGSGVQDGITGNNGDTSTYNTEGWSAKNAGQGIVLPGTVTAKRYQPSKPTGMAKPTGMGMKKKTTKGMGFLAPNSETFQMLE